MIVRPIIVTAITVSARVSKTRTAGSERVLGRLNARPVVAERPEAVEIDCVDGRIELDHVSLVYRGGVEVLRDVCLPAYPGETVAIVGPTGAGKSTIINFVCRFYEVSSRRVLIDAIAVRGTAAALLFSKVRRICRLGSGSGVRGARFAVTTPDTITTTRHAVKSAGGADAANTGSRYAGTGAPWSVCSTVRAFFTLTLHLNVAARIPSARISVSVSMRRCKSGEREPAACVHRRTADSTSTSAVAA